MKYTNGLKKLLLLSSLALSFGVRGDGTLPLPRDLQDGTLPLAMSGRASAGVSTTPTEATLSVAMQLNTSDGSSVDPSLKTCAAGEKFYPAGGIVDTVNSTRKETSYEIKGMCAPSSASSNRRQIIATSAKNLAIFDGTFNTTAKTFNGILKLATRGVSHSSGISPAGTVTPSAAVNYDLKLIVE